MPAAPTDDWLGTDLRPVRTRDPDVLTVDVEGYEGPLDLLLDLARRQKVDLASVSILALAEQYLRFVSSMRERRIEVAADYLVMAAWLAYLKSRLMVPQAPSDEEPSGEMLAALLQFRLQRLEAMRDAAAALMARPRRGQAVFARGAPEPLVVDRNRRFDATLYDLLKAYAIQRERGEAGDYAPARRTVFSLQEARDILERLIGEISDWTPLEAFLAEFVAGPAGRATVTASSFVASLELVRQGRLELRQNEAFGPLLLRPRS